MWWVWIRVYKPETNGSCFFLFWKISLRIVQVGVKTWKWNLLENDESPKISPGLSRERVCKFFYSEQKAARKR